MKRERGADDPREEPAPGQGIRSLHSWQRLSAARRALAGDAEAESRMANDPAAVLTQLGVDPSFVEIFLRQQAEAQAPVAPVRDFAGRDLEDEDEDQDDEMSMGGGCGSPKPTAKAPLVSSQSGRISLKVV